jgi:NADPH-dependent 2,4-dienoyl-CoA reductase/sulfur reductase-like enzyme
VFAIGDVTGIPLEMGKPLPKAGVFAAPQAKVVAHNITHTVTGEGEPASFDGHGECFIETGAGKAGFGAGDFYAAPTARSSSTDRPAAGTWASCSLRRNGSADGSDPVDRTANLHRLRRHTASRRVSA